MSQETVDAVLKVEEEANAIVRKAKKELEQKVKNFILDYELKTENEKQAYVEALDKAFEEKQTETLKKKEDTLEHRKIELEQLIASKKSHLETIFQQLKEKLLNKR